MCATLGDKLAGGFGGMIATKEVLKSLVDDPSITQKPQQINSGKEAAKYLKDCKNICILTGAGLSAASGVPTFRGSEGFWKKKYANVDDATQILTQAYFKKHPAELWEWHFDFDDIIHGKTFNAGHQAIQDYIDWTEKSGDVPLLVT